MSKKKDVKTLSLCQFLASDHPVKDRTNPNIELLSVEEAENIGLAIPGWLASNGKINRQEKMVLYAPSEDCLDEIEIREDIDPGQVKRYSPKKYFSSLRWRFSETRALELITYIADHLQTAPDIEIWSLWLGEMDDDKAPIIKTIDITELTVSALKEGLDQGYLEKALCLIITGSLGKG